MESYDVEPFSFNPMYSVNLMSVKVMHGCTVVHDFNGLIVSLISLISHQNRIESVKRPGAGGGAT